MQSIINALESCYDQTWSPAEKYVEGEKKSLILWRTCPLNMVTLEKKRKKQQLLLCCGIYYSLQIVFDIITFDRISASPKFSGVKVLL